jgi:hypothetical protein
MLSEQPGKEVCNNPKSAIDPDEPMVDQSDQRQMRQPLS